MRKSFRGNQETTWTTSFLFFLLEAWDVFARQAAASVSRLKFDASISLRWSGCDIVFPSGVQGGISNVGSINMFKQTDSP